MKATEMRDMQPLELNKRLNELKQELFNLRFQHAINQLENPQRIVVVKKEIARVKTVMHEQNLQEIVLKVEQVEAKPEKKEEKPKRTRKAKKDEEGAAEEKPAKPKRTRTKKTDEEKAASAEDK